ncbi:MAG: flagellar hook-associated protein FlgL [Thalassovita sp.]
MTIGTSIHHSLANTHFKRLDDDISSLQAQISSGKADPRSSVDPVRALNMSASQDQKALIEQFAENLASADQRLGLSDAVLGEIGNVLERFAEIGIRGASGSVSPSERASLLIEAQELRSSMLSLAQSRDTTGRALFGGYQTEGQSFDDVNGVVTYVGDTGQHSLRVSENATMVTGMNGQQVFMEVPVETEDGTEIRDIFSMVDDLIQTLRPGGGDRVAEVAVDDSIRLLPGSATGLISMTIEGPLGQAEISAPYMMDAPDALIAAINAQSAATGITAAVDPDNSAALRLTGAGTMTLSELSIEGGNDRNRQSMSVVPLVAGQAQEPIVMVSKNQTANSLVAVVNTALSHIADSRAEVGALQQVGERYASSLDKRTEMIDKALAGYEGLDVAAAITELQALLLNRDAAQQTYAKISTRTLFDFLG